MTDLPVLESLSASINLDRIGDEPVARQFEASDADRQALAAFLGVPAIDKLSGRTEAVRHGRLITVTGHLEAMLTRQCVASLEELTEEIDEDLLATFTEDTGREFHGGEEVEADLDAPEPLDGDTIDLGAVLLEQLFLAMDPHPRKEGAKAPEDPGAGQRISPFDVLGKLKG